MPITPNYGNEYPTAVIANGQAKSGIIDLRGVTLTGFIAPVALDGASVTFEGSIDGENFYVVRGSNGSPLSVTLSGTGIYKVSPVDFLGITHLKVVAASNQTAERSITAMGGKYTES